jgi:hypothetical protein
MDTSPLGLLPAELRNNIYERVLRMNKALQIERYGNLKPTNCSTARDAFALLRTCKQLHNEMAPLGYSLNTFSFTSFPTCIENFLAKIGNRNKLSLRCVRLSLRLTSARKWLTCQEKQLAHALKNAVHMSNFLHRDCAVEVGLKMNLEKALPSAGKVVMKIDVHDFPGSWDRLEKFVNDKFGQEQDVEQVRRRTMMLRELEMYRGMLTTAEGVWKL